MPVVLKKGTRVFHGTKWTCDENWARPFNVLGTGIGSEIPVAWVTTEWAVADHWSRDVFGMGLGTKEMRGFKYKPVVLSVELPRDLKLFDLEHEKVCHANFRDKKHPDGCITYDEFEKQYADEEEDGLNAIYDYVDQKKYDGAYRRADDPFEAGKWFDDYAIFERALGEIVFDRVEVDDKEVPFEKAKAEFDRFCK